jgi:DNA-directed RNA polymerase subunit RPC12/RpoP
MRTPLDTTTQDTVLAFLLCVLLLAAVAIVWDAIRLPHCSDCDKRPRTKTGADLDAMEASPGRCPDCAHRHIRIKAAILAAADCAANGCGKTWNGTEWVCPNCGRPLTIERTPAS